MKFNGGSVWSPRIYGWFMTSSALTDVLLGANAGETCSIPCPTVGCISLCSRLKTFVYVYIQPLKSKQNCVEQASVRSSEYGGHSPPWTHCCQVPALGSRERLFLPGRVGRGTRLSRRRWWRVDRGDRWRRMTCWWSVGLQREEEEIWAEHGGQKRHLTELFSYNLGFECLLCSVTWWCRSCSSICI